MDGYYDNASSNIRDLIGQMAMEMEKKAEECKGLRSELAKKDQLLQQAENTISMLQQECRAAKRDLAAAEEERAKIASILGFGDSEVNIDRSMPKHASKPTYVPSDAPPYAVQLEFDSSLSGYASAALERIRELNRTLPTI